MSICPICDYDFATCPHSQFEVKLCRERDDARWWAQEYKHRTDMLTIQLNKALDEVQGIMSLDAEIDHWKQRAEKAEEKLNRVSGFTRYYYDRYLRIKEAWENEKARAEKAEKERDKYKAAIESIATSDGVFNSTTLIHIASEALKDTP